VVRELKSSGDAVKLEMQAGVIPVTAQGDAWTLKANAPRTHVPHVSRVEFAQMLGLDVAEVLDGALWVDTGSEQLIMPLASAGAVERCQPNPGLLMRYSVGNRRKGLAYVWARVDDATIRARFFFTKHASLVEDPGTGSACANLGGWFIAQDKPLPLDVKVLQGDQIGRPCRLGLRVDAARNIFVSGRVIALGGGEITL
jgi:PhzF family phenazine biosynthesis protein